jgi:hypothetical protein
MSMLVWLLADPALAAPRFAGEPEDIQLAQAAWEAARTCAGREGRASPTVEIVRRAVPGDYLGVARTTPSGELYRIDLNTDEGRHREVLVHEVTHAWVSDGPVALVEGTAKLLADCIVSRDPALAPLQFDDGRDLSGMPDLVSWGKPTEGIPSELHATRTDAYVGAARLIRTVALVVPPQTLFSSHTLDWATLEAALRGSGPRGAELLAVLGQGSGAQRQALADEDRDGLVALAEGWLGTDDQRFDSDGDGWWDGGLRGLPFSAPPPEAVVVPLDGTPVCLGREVLPAQPLAVWAGGNLRGLGVPDLSVRRAPGDGPRPVLVSLASLPSAESTGARWATLSGDPGRAGCASSRTVTVWAEDPAFARRVAEVAAQLERLHGLAEARLGPGPERVALALGGARSTVEGEVVWLSSADVARALSTGRVEELASLAVSLRRLWVAGERDWNGALAVSRSLMR